MNAIAFALARDQVVVTYGFVTRISKGAISSYRISGLRRTDGSKVWTLDLPEQPLMDRLALDRDGRILVSLCDGSVICLGRQR
jgi:hypothetical protein